ncbi:hypothetical protein UPYG_G00076720 [Umbra pygmaea]|uniref:Uncharacterized protein n=1 Tax=Umbra pygmaea TaxID=75934 RepID=A0ABD0XCV5_UMBPY
MTRKQPCSKWNDPCGVRMLWKCVHGRGNVGQLLTQISLQTNTTEPTAIRTQVLRGLPIILGDNPRNLFEAGFESDDDDSFRDLDIGILLIEREGAVLSSFQHLSPA